MRLYKDKIIKNIHDKNRNEDSPFYMYLPLQTIHGPLDEIHDKQSECDEILGLGASERRQKYCQNMLLTDDIIGDIIDSLKDNGYWDNTLLVFTSDNGADVSNAGCNYPLRGTKGTLFDGNIKTLALVAGGIIPEKQKGKKINVLFSSLDWTPTLLEFAGIYDEIDKKDRTWDGISQYNLLMNGVGEENENKLRDHIVLNIGRRDFSSASIIFEKDGITYKYVSENEEIDTWAYKRDDGWCVPDENNNWGVILDTDISLSSHVDNKYLFDLTNDISEKTNLFQLNDEELTEGLKHYATKLMKPYVEHQLYGEHLRFLWIRMPAGDPSQLGEGAFVAPFLTELEYFKHVSRGFSGIEEEFKLSAETAQRNGEKFQEQMPYTKALKGLYFKKWTPPHYGEDLQSQIGQINTTKPQNATFWYIYLIIAVVIVAFIIIVVVSIMKYRQIRNIYKGYQPINEENDKENETTPTNGDSRDSSFVTIEK